jgi:hypothetical protein
MKCILSLNNDDYSYQSSLFVLLIFQLIKFQFVIAGRIAGAAVGAPVHAAAIVSLDLAKHIRDKLPIQNGEHFLELKAWLTDSEDDILTVN